jgi:hypothetical protein
MEFHDTQVSNLNRGQEMTTTYKLNGISEQACQQFNKDQGVHSHSQTRWDFMVGMSTIQTEAKRCTATHKLDGIS